MSFDRIFFDLDGTLTDPKIGITSSVMHALEHYGFPVPPREELLFFIGPPLFESFMKYCGFDKEKAKEAVEYYREYYRPKGIFELEVYEGIPELLRDLKAAGKTVVMATSKPELFASQIAEHYGFADCFDLIVGSTMDGSLINKDDVLATAMKRLGIGSPEGCCMVGDRFHDAEGAKANGMYSVSVTYGYGSREEFIEHGTDKIVDTVKELRDFLLS